MSTSPRHIVVVTNPTASFGRNADAGARTCSALTQAGFSVTELKAENFELLQGKLRRALLDTPDAVVSVGGDGMVSLVINVVAGTSFPFAVMPAGTGNDLARGLGIPLGSIQEGINHLLSVLESSPQRIDLGKVSRGDGTEVRWFASILSAGFDAIVNERANAMRWPKGKSRYTWALLRELMRLNPVEYHLGVDGQVRRLKAVLISIANNAYMGGGMKVAPNASLTDGLLDVFVLTPLRRGRFLRLFPRVFAGTHISEPEVVIERCRVATLDAPGIVAYADGERVGPLPIRVEVVPEAVRVFL